MTGSSKLSVNSRTDGGIEGGGCFSRGCALDEGDHGGLFWETYPIVWDFE